MTQDRHITAGTNYTVEAGDSLSSIAQVAYGNAADWPRIYEANKQVIGPNPNLLRVGEVLVIPALSPTPGMAYAVQQGDTLSSIAQRAYSDSSQWQLIYNANKQVIGDNPNIIRPGEVLHIPPAPSANLPLRNSTEIQGDILAGFNKDNRMYLFLRFPDQSSGPAWLKELVPLLATTKDVASFNAQFSAARASNGGVDPSHLKATWVGVSLTFDGLKMLLKADPTDALNTQGFPSFVAGPVNSAPANGDTLLSDPKNWLVGNSTQSIHALLNIQSDDPNDLAAEVQKLQALNKKHNVTLVFEQPGATLPGALKGHEHFGFKDGISQPGVADFDITDPHDPDKDPTALLGHVLGHPGTEIIQAGEFVLGQPVESDSGGQVFSPSASLNWMKNGSFLVFRRLRQDVPSFSAQLTNSLHSLPPGDPMKEDLLGAKLVGRWKSGTPIDLSPNQDNNLTDSSRDNNFNFVGDDEGFRCPRFAHIRKVYPREQDFAGNRAKRIIRRGVPFGLPFDPAGGSGHDAHSDRGLLFFAYMSSIEQKFEFLMQAWVNNTDFPVSIAGPDPIIGDHQPRPSPCNMHRQGKPDFDQDFQRFVHTTGTLYAFTPSITALNQMANGTL